MRGNRLGGGAYKRASGRVGAGEATTDAGHQLVEIHRFGQDTDHPQVLSARRQCPGAAGQEKGWRELAQFADTPALVGTELEVALAPIVGDDDRRPQRPRGVAQRPVRFTGAWLQTLVRQYLEEYRFEGRIIFEHEGYGVIAPAFWATCSPHHPSIGMTWHLP
jgi:hypothetical protein